MYKRNSKNCRLAFARFASILATSVSATLIVSGCANGEGPAPAHVATRVDGSLGCSNFEAALWTSFAKSIEDSGKPPSGADVESVLNSKMKTGRLSKMSISSKAQVGSLAGEIASVIAARNDGPATRENSKTVKTESTDGDASDPDIQREVWLERIAQLELGDRTTPAKSEDVDLIQEKIFKLKSIARSEGVVDFACAAVSPPSTDGDPQAQSGGQSAMLDGWKKTQASPVYGALKTMATMYQSCDAATHPPLGSETDDVEGIRITGRHPGGGGFIRLITDKSAYLGSHPYVGSGAYRRPLPACFDVQTSPSIYDFGGKPYTSTANEKVLNFFKNAGTGSRDLGMDCSAMVYSAYATVGLKFKRGTALKASFVNGVSSTMLKQPQANGLTCLNHATFKGPSSLNAGDIIAIAGHVVMVSKVGADPFGLADVDSISGCRASAMSIDRFNFNIFQSDPSKGGIGVNQMEARYYLSMFSAMGRGMIDHAVNACRAKFQVAPIVSTSSSASVVRHLGTADCVDAVPVKLTQEECLNSCSARPVESI